MPEPLAIASSSFPPAVFHAFASSAECLCRCRGTQMEARIWAEAAFALKKRLPLRDTRRQSL